MTSRKYQITIIDTGEKYWCREGEHLLQGMLSLGKKGIPSGCHGGGCGVCKIQVQKGKGLYRNKSMSRAHISEKDELKNIVLACRTFPEGDIELTVVGGIKKSVMRSAGTFSFNYSTAKDK